MKKLVESKNKQFEDSNLKFRGCWPDIMPNLLIWRLNVNVEWLLKKENFIRDIYNILGESPSSKFL